MSRFEICYATCCLPTQTVAPNLTVFQCIKRSIQYLDSHPQKLIFYPSNSYDGSNVIRLTWSENQFDDYTTQNFLEFRQDADHAIIINRRQAVSGIVHTLIGVAVCCKVHIQPDIAYDSAN